MPEHALVVADPPHGEVDLEQAAACLDLPPAVMAGKTDYGVPEVWYADADIAAADQVANRLRSSGCSVVVLSSVAFAAIPRRMRMRSFSFDDAAMVAHLETSDLTVEYDRPVVVVSCRPREVGVRSSGAMRRTSGFMTFRESLLETGAGVGGDPGGADAATPFLDLYVPADGQAVRVGAVQGKVNFSGLGQVQPRAAANMITLVERCAERFPNGTVDRRLEDMVLRAHIAHRAGDAEHRVGYSFGSPGFLDLMGSISPELRSLTQSEYAARLAYLTGCKTA